METLSISILNPKVKKLLKSLAALDLIEIIPEKIKFNSKNLHTVDNKKKTDEDAKPITKNKH